MEHAKHINASFMGQDGKPKPKQMVDLCGEGANPKDVEALQYILNYLEFVAVGIRQGELDEALMKQTLRGIVVNVRDFAKPYIAFQRGVSDGKVERPKYLEHFLWLDARWRMKSEKSSGR